MSDKGCRDKCMHHRSWACYEQFQATEVEWKARGLFAVRHASVTLQPRSPMRKRQSSPASKTAMQVDRPPGLWQAADVASVQSSEDSGEDLKMLTNSQLDDLKMKIKIQQEFNKRLEYKESPLHSGVRTPEDNDQGCDYGDGDSHENSPRSDGHVGEFPPGSHTEEDGKEAATAEGLTAMIEDLSDDIAADEAVLPTTFAVEEMQWEEVFEIKY
jgi:hypothetical protein